MYQPPRMLLWAALTICLIGGALVAQEAYPGTLLAVSLYKAHLLALAGWGGYWLDRALFPYGRPHEYLKLDELSLSPEGQAALQGADGAEWLNVSTTAYPMSMMRRAVIVAGCLVCVGLGA